MDPQADQIIGHYRLIEQIGAGGMGIVWKAVDTKLNRHVAIKILPPALTADHDRRMRFQREAQTAAALSHPNIAVIHEVGEHEGTPFLVMELLTGKTLFEAMGNRRLAAKQTLDYALPIAEALAHAHKNGIVHRDLKAANVMITEDGHVKLLDFGLAKLVQADAPSGPADGGVHETISQELTRAGKVLGTVAYMSPEQARGEAVDHRSDIFSFGVLLYQMMTGNLPFKGASDIESLNATLTSEPPSLSELNEDVPADAERIVIKAMEKEPGRRYQNADDIVIDFKNLKRDLDTGRVSIVSSRSGVTAAVRQPPSSSGVKPWILGAAAVVILAAAASAIFYFGSGGGEATAPASAGSSEDSAATARGPTRIVVLPFENLGPSEDEFFSAGVTEEIIGRLASVRELSVISRTSAFQYDKSGKSLQQIGQDFDVDHVLEGTVRWAKTSQGSRVRISPRLVRVTDDSGIWAESYDAPMDDIFQVQTDIAERVIDALGVVLLAQERESLESRPTENQEAYHAYLRGFDALTTDPTTELAEQMFRRAVDLDPGFAIAWAGLSRAHSWRFHGGDRSPARCESAKVAADEATRLAPDAPETYMALGLYYYRCFRDYEKGLAQIELAGRDRPNDTDVLSWKATMNKRQGNFREAVRLNQRVLQLDPMDFTSASELGIVHHFLREYPESSRSYDQTIAIKPDLPGPYLQKAALYYSWKGSTAEARRMLEAMPRAESDTLARVAWFSLEYREGRYREALARLDGFDETMDDQETLNSRDALRALCHEGLGDTASARASWEAAVKLLRGRANANPEDFRTYSDLGVALAALGRKDEAIEAARRAVELMPLTKDAEAGSTPLTNLALVYSMVGEQDAALEQVEQLLSNPGRLSIAEMRLDPRWRALVSHPRFAALAQRFEK